jgi:hypothetical protein
VVLVVCVGGRLHGDGLTLLVLEPPVSAGT